MNWTIIINNDIFNQANSRSNPGQDYDNTLCNKDKRRYALLVETKGRKIKLELWNVFCKKNKIPSNGNGLK